jgi:hypothetical protein
MKFTKEQVEIIYDLDGCTKEFDGFKFVASLPTLGGGEKYQTLRKIFSFKGKNYLACRSMSGSYFSDFEKDEADEEDFGEVEQKEITKTVWVFSESNKEVS